MRPRRRKAEIEEIRERYRRIGRTLSELERRRWAAREAIRIGWGGIAAVCKAIVISPNTVKRGIQEILSGEPDLPGAIHSRIRKPGAGRKPRDGSRTESTDRGVPGDIGAEAE